MENNLLTKALIDVRKAYRLLFEFQKRILNMMQFLSNATNLEFNGGYARYSGYSPREGKGSLDDCPWDWLNMYLYEFNFIPLKENTYLSILLVSDDGFYLKLNEAEINNTRSFTEEEKSNSYFVYMCGLEESWKQDQITEHGELLKGEEISMTIKNKFVAKKYFLQDLQDEVKLIDSIKDFNNLCRLNKLPIVKINENFNVFE